jgi:hypothetical protein
MGGLALSKPARVLISALTPLTLLTLLTRLTNSATCCF